MKAALSLWLLFAAGPAAAGGNEAARAGAWDRSVVAQTEGDLVGAEAIMTRAWGERPDNYWAALRLAYLALLQGRGDEAAERYQALRERPEAADDPDVVRGHASAVAAVGWKLLDRGEVASAREQFRSALAIDEGNPSATQGLAAALPAPTFSPGIWAGYFGQALGMNRYRGWALYGNLPVRIADLFVLRLAGRYLSASPAEGRSRWAVGSQGARRWTLDEQYLSLSREGAWLGGELVGLRSGTTGRSTIFGGAGRLRVGESWGGILEASYMRAQGVATNTQVRPSLFYWPLPQVGMQLGARLTRDDRGNSTSANAGLSLCLASIALHLRGHVGSERWAIELDGPSIMSFDTATTYGGSTTVIWSPTGQLRLALSGEGERMSEAGASGYFWSFSGGLQYLFRGP